LFEADTHASLLFEADTHATRLFEADTHATRLLEADNNATYLGVGACTIATYPAKDAGDIAYTAEAFAAEEEQRFLRARHRMPTSLGDLSWMTVCKFGDSPSNSRPTILYFFAVLACAHQLQPPSALILCHVLVSDV
jgi:hypothetical protein